MPKNVVWLFPSEKSKCGHTMDIRKPFCRVVEAAGLDSKLVVRHTLRHTAITHLVQAGVDLPTVKRISGHKTLAMVERYSHANGAHIQEAMDKLENRMASGKVDASSTELPQIPDAALMPDYTEITQIQKTEGAASLQPLDV